MKILLDKINFNTSHVVVYPKASLMPAHSSLDFNTSHVVVYQWSFSSTEIPFCISIHLMLQFIGKQVGQLKKKTIFQYISCCSLSFFSSQVFRRTFLFQYISCCSLSKCPEFIKASDLGFQYISCCSLSIIFTYNNYIFLISIHLMLQFILYGRICNTR